MNQRKVRFFKYFFFIKNCYFTNTWWKTRNKKLIHLYFYTGKFCSPQVQDWVKDLYQRRKEFIEKSKLWLIKKETFIQHEALCTNYNLSGWGKAKWDKVQFLFIWISINNCFLKAAFKKMFFLVCLLVSHRILSNQPILNN